MQDRAKITKKIAVKRPIIWELKISQNSTTSTALMRIMIMEKKPTPDPKHPGEEDQAKKNKVKRRNSTILMKRRSWRREEEITNKVGIKVKDKKSWKGLNKAYQIKMRKAIQVQWKIYRKGREVKKMKK